MAAAGCSAHRQFAAACGVLSRCVRAEAATAAPPTMLLMPGAEVAPPEAAAVPPPQQQAQLTIMYAGRVLVLDDFPADRAAELVRFAARPDAGGAAGGVPVPRKASLQRFMDKRRDRLAARAPYAGAARPSHALKERDEGEAEDARCWLGLGVPGGCAC